MDKVNAGLIDTLSEIILATVKHHIKKYEKETGKPFELNNDTDLELVMKMFHSSVDRAPTVINEIGKLNDETIKDTMELENLIKLFD